jgi:hypothetical protein
LAVKFLRASAKSGVALHRSRTRPPRLRLSDFDILLLFRNKSLIITVDIYFLILRYSLPQGFSE